MWFRLTWIVLGNFDRLDATLDCFQPGLGVGTMVTRARVLDAMSNGHVSYTFNIRESNKEALSFQERQMQRLRHDIKDAREGMLAGLGIRDDSEPDVIRERVEGILDDTGEAAIRMIYHLYGEQVRKV